TDRAFISPEKRENFADRFKYIEESNVIFLKPTSTPVFKGEANLRGIKKSAVAPFPIDETNLKPREKIINLEEVTPQDQSGFESVKPDDKKEMAAIARMMRGTAK